MSVNVSGGSLIFDAAINMGDFDRNLERMRRGLNDVSEAQKKQAAGVEDFAKKAAAAAAGFLSIQAATGFIKSMVQVRGEFQQIEVAFTTMLKSKDAADKLMAQAVKLAAITPFTLQEVASGAKQLLAYGFAASDVTKNLEMLGNIASGVGSDLNSIVYLYGTLRASGRVTQMDINQFAGRGIPIYEALAKVMKINTNEVRSYVSAGKVGFPQVEEAFRGLTGPAGQFFNLMQEQSKTLTGQLSNLEDAWARMLNDLGKDNEGLFSDAIGGAIELVGNYKAIIEILEGLILVYGAYRAAIVLTNVTLSGASFAEATHYAFLVAKDKILGLVASKTAAAAAVTAGYTAVIAALGAVIYSFIQYQDAEEIAQKAVNKAMADGERAADSERGKIEGLVETIQSHKATKVEQKAAYDALQSEMGNYLRSYSLEEVAAGKADGAIVLFTGHIANMTAAEKEYAAYKGLGDKIDELGEKGIAAVGKFDRLRQSFANLFGLGGISSKDYFKTLFSTDAANDVIVKNEINKFKTAQEKLLKGNDAVRKKVEDAAKRKRGENATGLKGKEYENFNDEFAKGNIIGNFDRLLKLAPNKAALDKLKESVNGSLEALAPGDKSIALYKAKIKQVDDIIAQYSASKDNSKADQAAKDRLAFLQNLNKLEQSAIGKTLTDNEEALKTIADKYEAQRSRAKELGLGAGVIARLNAAEKNESGSLKYDQDTKALKESLDKQKTLYAEYEDFKLRFGEDAARERYAGQINIEKSFLQKLQDEQKKLTDIPVDQRTGGQAERLKLLNDMLNEERTREQKSNDDRLEDALKVSESINIRRIKMTDDYLKTRAEIEKLANKAERDERLAQLDKSFSEDKDRLIDEQNEKSELYKRLGREVLLITRQETVDQIEQLKNLLATVKLPPEVKKNIEQQLGKLQVQLKIGADQSNLNTLTARRGDVLSAIGEESKKSKPDLIDLQKQLAEINKQIKELDGNGDGKVSGFKTFLDSLKDNKGLLSAAKITGSIADNFTTLGNALSGVDAGLSDTLGTIGTLAGAATNILSSLASGDPLSIIGSVVGAVGSLFSLGSAARESAIKANKELAEFTTNVLKGGLDFNAVLRERAILLSQQGVASTNNLKNQREALILAQQQNLVDQGIINQQLAGDKQKNAELLKQIDSVKKLQLVGKGLAAKLSDQLTGGRFISGERTEKYGGIFGAFQKTRVVQEFGTLAGKTYEDIERLYSEGRLEGTTKTLFEQLKKLKEEGEDFESQIKAIDQALKEAFTGTNAQSLTDAFADLFKNGKPAIEDLANFFEKTMSDAAQSTFKNKVLADLLSGFYDEFAKAAQSDDTIDQSEYDALQAYFNSLSADAIKQYEAFSKITGGNVLNTGTGNNLENGFKGMTQQTAELIAGQFGGQRLAQLENNRIATDSGLTLKQIAAQGAQKIALLQQIALNTDGINTNTAYLSDLSGIKAILTSIDKKTGAASSTLGANGLPGI